MDGQCIKVYVPEHKKSERLDTFLTRSVAYLSRTQIQKLIKEGYVTVDGKNVKSRYMIRPDEEIDLFIPKSPPPLVVPENIPIDIIYEDEAFLIINKKAGMVVHPAHGHSTGTLVNALLGYSQYLSRINDSHRPGIVHRIDKDTSGLLVVAKTDDIHRKLAVQFQKKTVKRMYMALVWGKMKKGSGSVETNISRSARDRKKMTVAGIGKNAVTHFEVAERLPLTTLLRLHLETGRTHQIRVHLSYMGYPVFGDPTYGGRGSNLGGLNQEKTALAIEVLHMLPRQALHAKTLGFIHPLTNKEVFFNSDLPEDFSQVLERLRRVNKEG
jgi:23S rRNA pseudouridine1911/1915/1917 synthase